MVLAVHLWSQAAVAQVEPSEQALYSSDGSVEILSDKVYPYSRFDVLFKTPFLLSENVRIREIPASPPQSVQADRFGSSEVLRTDKIGYSRYRDAKGRQRRAFILGFSVLRAGLHRLPRLRFDAIESDQGLGGTQGKGRTWQSPALPFAAFQVDEGELALPVDVSLNTLPSSVYVGQNILLHLTAERVQTIDQSFLPLNPEFRNFLVQDSPVAPQIERLEILGEDVYRVSLGSWLLNPIEPGLLQIPAISASVMGRERKTEQQQIEVLPLPPNPYRERAAPLAKGAPQALGAAVLPAIGRFALSFEWHSAEKIGQMGENPEFVPKFAEDERIRAVLRISGTGNLHILSFPAVSASSNLVLLQTEERDLLDVLGAELSGRRERELIYRAKSPGNYQLRLEPFSFFDPKERLWQSESEQTLEFQVVTQNSYYSNLEELHFSRFAVFASNVVYALQEYAFYACLGIFLLTSLYFLLFRPRLKLRLKYLLPGLLVLGVLAWSFALHLNKRQFEHSDMQYRDMPGKLANLALSMYRDSRTLEALKAAYLYYFYQPFWGRRLVSSLRIEQGLSPKPPDSFFWALQLRQTIRYLGLFLFILCSAFCVFQKKRMAQLFPMYRRYSVFAVLLLFVLAIPWRFSLAVNVLPNTALMPIPRSEIIENGESQTLKAGELVRVSGRIVDILVIGEEQKKGWVESRSLFFLPEY